MNSLITFLKKTDVFSLLSEQELTEISSYIKEAKYTQKTRIIKEGESSDALYLIQEGFVHVVRGKTDDVFIATLGPGDTFGEAALFHKTKRIAHIDTDENTTLLIVEKEAFDKILEKYPSAASKILLQILKQLFVRLERTSHELQFERTGHLDQDAIDGIFSRI